MLSIANVKANLSDAVRSKSIFNFPIILSALLPSHLYKTSHAYLPIEPLRIRSIRMDESSFKHILL